MKIHLVVTYNVRSERGENLEKIWQLNKWDHLCELLAKAIYRFYYIPLFSTKYIFSFCPVFHQFIHSLQIYTCIIAIKTQNSGISNEKKQFRVAKNGKTKPNLKEFLLWKFSNWSPSMCGVYSCRKSFNI